MNFEDNKMYQDLIENGKCSVGIELGSTRIKAVLIDENANILATGTHDWENVYENGIWTYHLEDVISGLQASFASLKEDVKKKHGVSLKKVSALGISAMMHGLIALGEKDELLAPFRTWRNTNTDQAAADLTELFGFNIPQRWSVAHFWQQALDGEAFIPKIKKMMTLSAYVHYLLSGEFVIGVGDASGMFPTVAGEAKYDPVMLEKINALMAQKKIGYRLEDVLPTPLFAGKEAGRLSSEGAKLLDPEGELLPGALMCPPEGDAGTGMVATNSVRPLTGNISAGTSVFVMMVLKNRLTRYYPEIDVVATPSGAHVAMVHCNNCSSELNAFADMFSELNVNLQGEADRGKVLSEMFRAAEKAEGDCGGVVCCNYLSGEHITGFSSGRPLIARTPESRFNLANFSRAMIYSAFATVNLGMKILEGENIQIECMMGHGGLFKSDFTAKVVSAALSSKVATMSHAGEGGAWGIALLALFAAKGERGLLLEEYLEKTAFKDVEMKVTTADEDTLKGFGSYMESYQKLLLAERAAVENL